MAPVLQVKSDDLALVGCSRLSEIAFQIESAAFPPDRAALTEGDFRPIDRIMGCRFPGEDQMSKFRARRRLAVLTRPSGRYWSNPDR